jgi:hypothetical protein
VSRINQKLGIKPAGKRSMMKLPADRELRSKLTSAVCPTCGQRGAFLSRVTPGHFICSWCHQGWNPDA